MISKKLNYLIISVCSISILAAAIAYFYLPEIIPMHWNIKGEIDNYGPKASIFILGSLPAIMYIVMILTAKIDPKKENYKKHGTVFKIVTLIVPIFLTLINFIVIIASFNVPVKINVLVPILVGILFIFIGNYMPQMRNNYFMGIRTPWTLASDTVWKKTHKLGGYLFIIMGIFFILQSLYTNEIIFFVVIAFILGSTAFLFLYSYLLYKKEINNK